MYSNGLKQEEVSVGDYKYFQSILGDDDATVLQTSITLEYMIQLYHTLIGSGNTTEAAALKEAIGYQAAWFESIFTAGFSCSDGFSNGDFGTGDHTGEYFPYMVSKLWDAQATWTCGALSPVYMLPYVADLYAFQYDVTGNSAWLGKARKIYKDWYAYNLADNWVTPVEALGDIWAFSTVEGDAWAKWGQVLKNGLGYMYIESMYSVAVRRPTGANGHMPISAESKTFEAVQ